MNLNEWAKEIHQNAVDHGWWEEERDIDIWFLTITHTVDAKKYKDSFGDFLAKAHSLISQAFEADNKQDKGPRNSIFGDCVGFIMEWCELNEIDIEKIIEIKHEFNKTRPFKHGGKVI